MDAIRAAWLRGQGKKSWRPRFFMPMSTYQGRPSAGLDHIGNDCRGVFGSAIFGSDHVRADLIRF